LFEVAHRGIEIICDSDQSLRTSRSPVVKSSGKAAQTCDRFAGACDDHLFATLDALQQLRKLVFASLTLTIFRRFDMP
jgi:hypothetical protein